MKTNTWSFMGYSIGAVICIISTIRYFTIWLDYSQGASFIALGLTIMGFSWVYDRIVHIKYTLANIDDRIEEMMRGDY